MVRSRLSFGLNSSRLEESPSSAGSDRVRRAPGGAPEDEFLRGQGCKLRIWTLRLAGVYELWGEPVAIRRIAVLCGAARHPKAGFFFAKAAGVGPQEGLAKLGSIGGG